MTGTVTTGSSWLNKSSGTNLISAACVILGLFLPTPLHRPVLMIGLFGLSGAITNWLAIHMLFEKIPGLYGSGVIPERFEDFKREIHRLMMEQFFRPEHVQRFLDRQSVGGEENGFDFNMIIDEADMAPAFDGLVEVVQASQFGNLLGMVGGAQALEPLREPFGSKLKDALKDVAHAPEFQENLRAQMSGAAVSEHMLKQVDTLVQRRLEELTPQMVKEIMQQMIRDHLGWLVVWGGVFGGLIGFITSWIPFF
ncbi:DUF445 domain-containing protein [Candidatus Entotheonella palauensis]|uniref:DUF445 domain-containing protein n=1 Tax=Candidatus Entotheonella gemina TaxID=1429439 RepID=W4LLJ2_9BACT|nr:DUF445 domain-containing protein [Candidatus Entotheonella palauensis]ETW98963.1 MAG: hypothetical protein ETSY2_41835 [Candidatus Entotheonella gemina]